MIIIDTKLPAFRSLLNERTSKKGVKADIDEAAVASSDEEGIGLDLKDEPQEHSKDQYKDKPESKEEKIDLVEESPTEKEIKAKNMKLLNAL